MQTARKTWLNCRPGSMCPSVRWSLLWKTVLSLTTSVLTQTGEWVFYYYFRRVSSVTVGKHVIKQSTVFCLFVFCFSAKLLAPELQLNANKSIPRHLQVQFHTRVSHFSNDRRELFFILKTRMWYRSFHIIQVIVLEFILVFIYVYPVPFIWPENLVMAS